MEHDKGTLKVPKKWEQIAVINRAFGCWLKKIHSLTVLWKDWCWSWNSNTLATWCEELTHWKRPWCWEWLQVGGEGDDRGWDGWMASLAQWTWVWVNSRSWWWTGRLGVLWSMGLQRVRHNWATELNSWELCFIWWEFLRLKLGRQHLKQPWENWSRGSGAGGGYIDVCNKG